MEEEDLAPRKELPKPRDLEPMSVAALEAYIADLEAEIARARQAIAAKRQVRAGADSLFKK